MEVQGGGSGGGKLGSHTPVDPKGSADSSSGRDRVGEVLCCDL